MNHQNIPLLFQRYPGLRRSIPWLPLAALPTPVKPMPALGKTAGHSNLWVKMDDISGSLYGGNKTRKLEFLLGKARQERASSLITFGAYGSNHALATTLFGKDQGFQVILMLFPQPLDPAGHGLKNLLVNYALGAEVHLLSSPQRVLGECFGRGLTLIPPFRKVSTALIPPGGSSPLGCLGYVNAALELHEQIKEKALPPPAAIFLPVGSGGTMAGLLAGFSLLGVDYPVVGVRVVPKFLTPRSYIMRMVKRIISFMARHVPEIREKAMVPRECEFLSSYLGKGYGWPTPEGEEAVRMSRDTEGLQLEGTYSGKTMAAFLERARALSSDGRPLLFLNTFNSVDLSPYVPASIDPSDYPQALRPLLTKYS